METSTALPTPAPKAGEPQWSKSLSIFGAFICIIGVIANVAAFIIIGRMSKKLSRSIRLLLRHQAILDGLICLITAINMLQPSGFPPTGNTGFDRFLCHFWWGQTINWTLIALSIWNLVIIAIDRFMAIVYPLQYQAMNIPKFVIMIVLAYIFSIVVFVAGVFQVSVVKGQCMYVKLVQSKATEIFYNAYVYLWFFLAYLIPVIVFIVLYGWSIITLRRMNKEDEKKKGESKRSSEKALVEVTRTGVIITLIFIVTLSFDTLYYFLDRVTNSVKYIPFSPFQRFGVLMIAVNMIINPFIYVIFMPLYRRQMTKCWRKKCGRSDKGDISKYSQDITTSVTSNGGV